MILSKILQSSIINLVEYLPKNSNFNFSIMNYVPKINWQMLAIAIILGGHIRICFENNSFIDDDDVYTKSNAELVEKIVKIAKALGREIADPEEARKIIGL